MDTSNSIKRQMSLDVLSVNSIHLIEQECYHLHTWQNSKLFEATRKNGKGNIIIEHDGSGALAFPY